MSLDSVENLLEIPIDYVTEVNMEGFQKVVDTVGGITVKNPLDFTQDSIHFAAGEISLTEKKHCPMYGCVKMILVVIGASRSTETGD